MSDTWRHTDPFSEASTAQSMVAIVVTIGCFGTYAAEATSEGLGEWLPKRFDAALNYMSIVCGWRMRAFFASEPATSSKGGP